MRVGRLIKKASNKKKFNDKVRKIQKSSSRDKARKSTSKLT